MIVLEVFNDRRTDMGEETILGRGGMYVGVPVWRSQGAGLIGCEVKYVFMALWGPSLIYTTSLG